jgi:uncharacterized protein
MKNAINWFEIPVSDLARAKKFYETIFGFTMHEQDFGSFKMALFPSDPQGAGGALIKNEWYVPGTQGPLIYLNASPDLGVALGRVNDAGGQVIIEKRQISPEHGYMGVFNDSEGNRIALHSMS